MLKARLLTAAILLPLMLAALWYLPPYGMGALLGAFVLFAAWEWANLSGLTHLGLRLLYLAAVIASALLFLSMPVGPLLVVICAWWCWAAIELVYDKQLNRGVFAHRAGQWLGGILILAPTWLATFYLFAADARRPTALLLFFVLVWTADSVAYFVGRAVGKIKLAPHVSPGKSVEGVIGGVVAVAIVAVIVGKWVWELSPRVLVEWVVVAAVTALFSVVGDLTESKMKRIAGVKDSGRILPGHGGILDRIDALTAAAPIYTLGVTLIGRPIL